MAKFPNLEKIRSFAVVGATGLAGRECLDLISEHKLSIPRIKLLASEKSLGEGVEVAGKDIAVEVLGEDSFEDVDVAFFSVPKDVTKKYAPLAVKAGCIVMDDSNAFRMEKDVPLVVPQINKNVLKDFEAGIMATPNCSTTPLAMVVKPLMDKYGVKRVVASTYQSVSGAGKAANEELTKQTVALMNGKPTEANAFPRRIAFNCLPMIGPVLENGNTEEEQKMVNELRKILDAPDLPVSATAVRVPTFAGHGLSVNIEMDKNFDSVEEIRELLESFPGLKVVDQPDNDIFPINEDCVKSDHTFVGRIRRDGSLPSAVNLWVITDNLRKGAALNALESIDALFGYRSLH